MIQAPVAVHVETTAFLEEPDHSAAREALRGLQVPGIEVENRLMEGEPV